MKLPYTVEGVIGDATARVRQVRRSVSRTAPGPALVRGLAGGFAMAALLLAAPTTLSAMPIMWGVALLLGALVALAPRSAVVTLIVLLTAVAWLAATLVYGEEIALWRLVAVAATIYPAHTGAAIAAVLPYDAILAPGVLRRWAAQTALVLVGGVGLAVGGVLLASRVSGWSALVAPVVGMLAVAGLTLVLAWLVRRGNTDHS